MIKEKVERSELFLLNPKKFSFKLKKITELFFKGHCPEALSTQKLSFPQNDLFFVHFEKVSRNICMSTDPLKTFQKPVWSSSLIYF